MTFKTTCCLMFSVILSDGQFEHDITCCKKNITGANLRVSESGDRDFKTVILCSRTFGHFCFKFHGKPELYEC